MNYILENCDLPIEVPYFLTVCPFKNKLNIKFILSGHTKVNVKKWLNYYENIRFNGNFNKKYLYFTNFIYKLNLNLLIITKN